MNLPSTTLVALTLLAVPTLAQTQLVRGDVGAFGYYTKPYYLKCTKILLTSTTVDLQALYLAGRKAKLEYDMRVRVVSTTGRTLLNVLSAKRIPLQFDMGNVRLGRADGWHVLGNAGEVALVYLKAGGLETTSYLPLGPMGTWLLGGGAVLFNFGIIGNTGRFQFKFEPPNVRALVGRRLTGQAVVVSKKGALITNAQCKSVRLR